MIMIKNSDEIPDPKDIEKELGNFLNKKFGGNIKIISPGLIPQKAPQKKSETGAEKSTKQKINFDLRPEDLISYLDQYIVKQDQAKAVLATKISTHFNRIKHFEKNPEDSQQITGSIKSNILMTGPTGVGKTYMVKLIAQKLGVPFAKGDATKFSETGYVGGDVEDLVRDLVRQADDDIELAQCGIIYIDEIDKIAGSSNMRGSDISRTGVQRALLKPMEDTDVELKVPHDPVSMMQELGRFQETGVREKRVVNTANILFIVSGAFADMAPIIKKRLSYNAIGFGSAIKSEKQNPDILKYMRTEDLVEYGYESEFIGRLPIRTVFDHLTSDNLYEILKRPNNPVVLGKKLDFASYGIDIKFSDNALKQIADRAYQENTGARGLVSAVEQALLPFETNLPSTHVKQFAVTKRVIEEPESELQKLLDNPEDKKLLKSFTRLSESEKNSVTKYIEENWKKLSIKHGLTLSQDRSKLVAMYYISHITNLGNSIRKIKYYYEEVKKIELDYFNKHDVNIILEEDAIDFIIEKFISTPIKSEDIFNKLTQDFTQGLKLVHEKTDTSRFFITREALLNPEKYIETILKNKILE